MTLSLLGALAAILLGGAIALVRRGRSSRAAWEGTSWSTGPRGGSIPERVRRQIWQRDRGACVVCGTREDVRFERIIAVGRGGSNRARNLELRCARCQRLKDPRREVQRSGASSSGFPGTSHIGGVLKARGDR